MDGSGHILPERASPFVHDIQNTRRRHAQPNLRSQNEIFPQLLLVILIRRKQSPRDTVSVSSGATWT
jgi:hypothetical protein